jgi:hypothetical protein
MSLGAQHSYALVQIDINYDTPWFLLLAYSMGLAQQWIKADK